MKNVFFFLFHSYVCLNIFYSFRAGEIEPGRGEGAFSRPIHQVCSSGARHPRRRVNRGLLHGPVPPQQQPVGPGRWPGPLPEERVGAPRQTPLWCCHSRRPGPGGYQIPRSDPILVHTGIYLFTWDSMVEVLQFWQLSTIIFIQKRHLPASVVNWQQLCSQQANTCDPALSMSRDTLICLASLRWEMFLDNSTNVVCLCVRRPIFVHILFILLLILTLFSRILFHYLQTLLIRKFQWNLVSLLDAFSDYCTMLLYVDLLNNSRKFLKSFTDYYLLWQEKCGDFQTDLPLLAQDLLCCPSTSVPSERLFSISGLLSDNRSSQIKPHNLGGKLIIIPS